MNQIQQKDGKFYDKQLCRRKYGPMFKSRGVIYDLLKGEENTFLPFFKFLVYSQSKVGFINIINLIIIIIC